MLKYFCHSRSAPEQWLGPGALSDGWVSLGARKLHSGEIHSNTRIAVDMARFRTDEFTVQTTGKLNQAIWREDNLNKRLPIHSVFKGLWTTKVGVSDWTQR